MQELPMLRREPECPAARKIHGVDFASQGVVCCAMEQDIARDDGTALSMNAAEFGYLQHEATGGVYLTMVSDPSTVLNLCYGRELPVLSDDDHQARAHYSYCPVWEAEKERLAAGGDRLAEEEQPEPVSMGVPDEEEAFVPSHTLDASDPWAQARADLDLFSEPVA